MTSTRNGPERDATRRSGGETSHGVLLVDDERPVEKARHHAARERDVAPHAEDHIGAVPEYRARALPERDEQIERQQRDAQ